MEMIIMSQTAVQFAIDAAGLLVAYILIYGLWCMSLPATSVYGIRIARGGMCLALLSVLLHRVRTDAVAEPLLYVNVTLAACAIGLGGLIARWRMKSALTDNPARCAVSSSAMAAAATVAIAALELDPRETHGAVNLTVSMVAGILATTSLCSALIALAKLTGTFVDPVRLHGRPALLVTVLLTAIALGMYICRAEAGVVVPLMPLSVMEGLFAFCGVLFGAILSLPTTAVDIPISMSINNAMTGVAVALVGYLLRMEVLTSAGMLVAGASALLAQVGAKAANRSVCQALFYDGSDDVRGYQSIGASDAAVFMSYAHKLVIVPGYGLAVAQGQQRLLEFVNALQAVGVEVKVALHPMAGRIPGQMGILLSEARFPDTLILRSEEADDAFRKADIALVVGANDVVNPSASLKKALPSYGLPALNAALAKKLYVIKRGRGTGFAGIENREFAGSHCHLIFGDAQVVLGKMVEAIRTTETPVAA